MGEAVKETICDEVSITYYPNGDIEIDIRFGTNEICPFETLEEIYLTAKSIRDKEVPQCSHQHKTHPVTGEIYVEQ